MLFMFIIIFLSYLKGCTVKIDNILLVKHFFSTVCNSKRELKM